MNIEDVFGLMQEKRADNYTDNYLGSNADTEQLLCEISIHWLNECERKSSDWVGRNNLIDKLSQLLFSQVRVLSLVGISGIGKSSLALRLGCIPQLSQILPTLKIISFDTPKPSFDLFIKQILGTKIIAQDKFSPGQIITMMVNHLNSHPCLLILDAAEAIIELNKQGQSEFEEPRFAEFFAKLLTQENMRSRVIITSQIAPPKFLNTLTYPDTFAYVEHIQGLTTQEALLIFNQHRINPTNAVEQLYLQRIINEYNGHPLALRVIAGEIIEPPYHGDISAYWLDCEPSCSLPLSSNSYPKLGTNPQENTPQNHGENLPIIHQPQSNLVERVTRLIEQSFERLMRYSALAALLLCMGATYRYSTERSAWLFLISDYPTPIQTSAFQTLQQRLFIEESHLNQKVLYRLHRMIRDVAVDKMYQILADEIFDDK